MLDQLKTWLQSQVIPTLRLPYRLWPQPYPIMSYDKIPTERAWISVTDFQPAGKQRVARNAAQLTGLIVIELGAWLTNEQQFYDLRADSIDLQNLLLTSAPVYFGTVTRQEVTPEEYTETRWQMYELSCEYYTFSVV